MVEVILSLKHFYSLLSSFLLFPFAMGGGGKRGEGVLDDINMCKCSSWWK